MLDTQYRMHPGISLFPSTEFYLGGVRDGTVDAEGNVHPGLAPPKSVYLSAVGSPRSLREGLGLKLDYMLAVDGGLGDGSAERLGRLAQPRTLGKSAQEHSEVEARQTASVIFLDHEGNESLKDRSRVNHAEAHIIASVVVDLLLSNPVSIEYYFFILLALRSAHPIFDPLFLLTSSQRAAGDRALTSSINRRCCTLSLNFGFC